MAFSKLLLNDGTSRIVLNDGASFLLLNAQAAAAATVEERRGGAGHKVRADRYWKGKYAGTYNDQEWTEYLLAAIPTSVEEPRPQPTPRKKQSRKIRREVIEPEAYIPTFPASEIDDLLGLEIAALIALIEQKQSERIAALAHAALFKKRRQQEEDDIAFLLMVA